MTSVEIPRTQKGPLRALLRLDSETRTALLDKLEEAGPTLVAGKAALVETAGVSADDAAEILYTLLGIYYASRRKVLDPSRLVQALRADEELGKDLSDSEEMAAFFERLFTLDSSLGILSKAHRLAREHANLFCTADIVSDLRPVFDGADKPPVAATIVHTLRLAYHTGDGTLEELFVGLGEGDLESLSSILRRALKKDRSLHSFAEMKGLPLLATEEEEE